jgi:VWFA-related protein
MRASLRALLACACTIAGAAAQEQAAQPIRVTAREVMVDLVVHDQHGKLVRKLDPADVALYEDGVRQEIRSLRLVDGKEVRRAPAQAATPVVQPDGATPARPPAPSGMLSLHTANLVCLVFQDLSPETRQGAFEAALEFLNDELKPNTMIGVFSLSDRGVQPMAPFSGNRATLVRAIQMAAAGQISTLNSSQQLFTAMGLQAELTMTLPAGALPAQAGISATPAPPSSYSVDDAGLGSTLDASMATGEAAMAAQNPLGRRNMAYERVVATRELHALRWLVEQLKPLPFRKTVLLLSPGITRPASELDYWQNTLKIANQASIVFYAVEITGPTTQSPIAPALATMRHVRGLSQQQGAAPPLIDPAGAAMDRAQEADLIQYATITANTHASLEDLVQSTGGFLITDWSKHMIERVMDDVETHYQLTYHPASDVDDGRYHRIEVKLARKNLSVEVRNGYFAAPAPDGGEAVALQEMAGLRALNAIPPPRDFDYRAQALRYRSPDGAAKFEIAFDIPFAGLASVDDANSGHRRWHASLLALVKDATGQIVEQMNSDSPMDVPKAEADSTRTGRILFARALTLPPGHYTVETATVDWLSGRTSTARFAIDCTARGGAELSSVALVRRMDPGAGVDAAADPLTYQGKRIYPSLFTDLAAGGEQYLYFVAYPDPANAAKPQLRAQLLLNGRAAANQTMTLPPADASGAIPVLIQAAGRPGTHEMRFILSQGSESSTETIRYTVAAK